MAGDLDPLAARVLAALVDGYQARAGMKQRARSLSEYEIARRLGVTQYSYAEYDTSAEHADIRHALDLLFARGLIGRSQPSGRYDTFYPADEPKAAAALGSATPALSEDLAVGAMLGRMSAQLEQIVQLLRSIDRKLGPE